MSLEHAILGFLQYKPISGYDMKKMIDASINHFWSADQSQIYRTLNKLTTEGLIDMELIIQDNKPNSKVYHITDKGREEFMHWLSIPVGMGEPRIPWLIQIFFAARLSDDVIINIFEKVAMQLRNKIEAYKQIDKPQIVEGIGVFSPRDLFFYELTYDYGLMLHNAILQWTEQALVKLKRKEHPQF